MTQTRNALYFGEVVHTRVRPHVHKLRYRVFSLLVDCADLDGLARRVRLFSHNRFNLFALHDRDHGDGGALPDYLAGIARTAGYGDVVRRFAMLCYPRILGYQFNPLTVYYGFDTEDRVRLMIYEVNNTFGQRKTYVIPVSDTEHGVIAQACEKSFYVSPFNPPHGGYTFRLTPPARELTLGVALKEEGAPVLKAHFRARREPLTSRALLWALARTGWMTAKVILAIHFEALRLWRKGLTIKPRPPAPADPVAYVEPRERGSHHA